MWEAPIGSPRFSFLGEGCPKGDVRDREMAKILSLVKLADIMKWAVICDDMGFIPQKVLPRTLKLLSGKCVFMIE